MSEKEILGRIHLLTVVHDDLITDKDRQALQKILDLYNKEKEKNKELTDEYMIQKHLINPDFLKNYISKDKIREIIGKNLVIKDVESNNYRPIKNTTTQDIYKAFYKIKELLEEK